MKNFSLKACLFMSMLLISVSCRKDQESDIIPATANSITISEAQAWFEQNLAIRTNQQEPGSRTNQQKLKKGSKEPVWELAEESTTPEGKTLVVPLKYEQGKGPGKGTLSKLLITKNQHGQIVGQVMIALGDETYLKKNAYQLDGSNFTGVIRIEDWQEQFIKGFWYENGTQKGKVEERIAGSNSSKGGRTNTYSFTYMSTWYYRTCGYGYCSGWSVGGYDRYTIYVVNYNGVSGYYGTYINSNGGVPYDPGDPIQETMTINNAEPKIKLATIDASRVSNACIRSVIDLFRSDWLMFNDITLILDVFNTDGRINLSFLQVTTLAPNVAGSTSGYGTSESINLEIQLNGNVLPHSSREYIAATVAHEVIHGYLRVAGRGDDLNHDYMANNYVEIMIQALQDSNHTMPRDLAEALAWGGLQESAAWARKAAANPAWAQNVLNVNRAHRDLRAGIPAGANRCY